jgi:hypothetical protein
LIHKRNKALILANAMTRSCKSLPWKGKTCRNLGTKFYNFRSYTKLYMNFYRFKLALDRLKLTGKLGIRSIFLIFLKLRTY